MRGYTQYLRVFAQTEPAPGTRVHALTHKQTNKQKKEFI